MKIILVLAIGATFSVITIFTGSQQKLIEVRHNGDLCSSFDRDTCFGMFSSDNLPIGIWKCCEDGKYIEITYNHGLAHGLELVYCNSNKEKLYEITSYSNGVRQGVSTFYQDNGLPSIIMTYDNGYLIDRIDIDSLGNIITRLWTSGK